MTEHKRTVVPDPNQAVTPDDPPPTKRKARRGRLLLFVLVPAAVLLGLGAWAHWQTYAAAAQVRDQQAEFVPEVRVAQAKRVDAPMDLQLPGQTEAFDAANIYARATGYVAERRVDIGSRVRKGDLLLRIAAPDLDQQLAQAQAQLGQTEAALLQAKASLQQAQASTKLADVTKYRETTLAGQGWETRQNADNATSNDSVQVAGVALAQAGIAVSNANLRAQQATVQRLQELTGFERVLAPFNGVITARNVDTGDLLSADNGSGTPMFAIARDDVLRVAVYVPQSGTIGLRDGLAATVRLPELPGRVFVGRVSRTAASLQQASRSMLTEVDVPNPKGELRSGLFVNVTFQIPRERPGVVVPDEALVFGVKGMQVATVEQGDKVRFRPVTIYRDFGTTAELRDGLDGGETLVLTPPAELQDGSKVKRAQADAPAG